MAAINLTQAEIDALLAERTKLIASVASRQESIDSQDAIVQAATDADSAEKKAFDFYNEDIIGAYENECEELTGAYVDAPITKTELDEVGKLDSTQRLYPVSPATEPTRIAQFDGTPLITTDNEIPGVAPDPLTPLQISKF